MSYKCCECGHIFEEGEQANWLESRGEFWGEPCSVEMSGCPLCHGEYEETTRCKICGAEHLEDELNGGVCDDCIDDHRNDFETCYKISACDTQEIEINALLASILDVSEIERILAGYIRDNCPDVDCSAFIDADKYWFGMKLWKEVNPDEKGESRQR